MVECGGEKIVTSQGVSEAYEGRSNARLTAIADVVRCSPNHPVPIFALRGTLKLVRSLLFRRSMFDCTRSTYQTILTMFILAIM